MKRISRIVFLLSIAAFCLPAISYNSVSKKLSSCISSLPACLSACWVRSTRPCNRSAAIAPEAAPRVFSTPPPAPGLYAIPIQPEYEALSLSPTLSPVRDSTEMSSPTGAAATPAPVLSMSKELNPFSRNQQIIIQYCKGEDRIAFAQAEVLPDKTGHIQALQSMPLAHEHDYRVNLIELICDSLFTHNCTIITLDSPPEDEIITLYKKHHFSITKQGKDSITMKRNLRAHPPAIPTEKEVIDNSSEQKEEKKYKGPRHEIS